MINFILFNLFIGLINIILILISVKLEHVKILKPRTAKDKIKFLINGLPIYLCIYCIFSIPLFNIFILITIITEWF